MRQLEEGLIEEWYQYVFFVFDILFSATPDTRFIVLDRATGSYTGINGDVWSTIARETEE